MEELIILFLQGKATSDQAQELERWRSASPDHARSFDELHAVWELSGLHSEIDPHLGTPTAAEILRAGHRPTRTRHWWRAAAVLAALAAGVTIGRGGTSEPELQSSAKVEFRTGSDEMVSAVLEDGTVVRLGPRSRLQVRLSRTGRDVWMEGRAFFSVSRDEERPFRVHAGDGEAIALGTRFEVETRDEVLRLLVVDGRVAISVGGERTELGQGQQSRAVRGEPVEVIRVESPETLLDWTGAFVAFESTPLHQVVKEIEARFGLIMLLTDSAATNRTVTGWFGEEDRDRIPRIICRVAGVRCELEGEVVVITS